MANHGEQWEEEEAAQLGRGQGFVGRTKCARGRERRGERDVGAGVALPRRHPGPASSRRYDDATMAGQLALPGRVTGERERERADGWARVSKE
jgi:hypothetical protein